MSLKTGLTIFLALAAVGCTRPVPVDRAALDRVGAAVTLETCCDAKRKVPPAVTRMAEQCAMPVISTLQKIKLRSGYLADKPAAQARVFAVAEPLDLFATSLKGQASGQMSMGYFSHFSIYVGDETALRAAGVWEDPAVRPWHGKLLDGPMVIEAMAPRVTLAGRKEIFDSDALAVLRPTGLSAARKRTALRDLFNRIGTPFDATFDARTADSLFCTELPARVMPELKLPVRSVYGRPSYLPDEAVAQTLQGKLPMTLAGFVVADQSNWTEAGETEVAARILAYWPDEDG